MTAIKKSAVAAAPSRPVERSLKDIGNYNMNIVDMKQLSDELRFIANNVNAVCSFWEKVGTPAKNEEVSMYGFFTSEQLATIADKIDAIIKTRSQEA